MPAVARASAGPRRPVGERHWTPEQCESWLIELLIASLLPAAP